MLRLVLLALFVLVETEDLLGVNYYFDVDFYKDFNRKKCDNVNMWRLTRYESIGIKPAYDSDKAIQAVEECCASSFPIIFINGTLDINVYSQVNSQMFNLSIEVFDEDDLCVTSYIHCPSTKYFREKWQTVSLKINRHFKGYIRFRGRSLNEILLIDSFHYRPNNTVTFEDNKFKRSISDIEEDELIFTNEAHNQNEIIEGSGDIENETEDPPITDQPVLDQERDTMWNPFTITLVSFMVVLAVTLLATGAYHYGKIRAGDRVPLRYDDEEPPRTITIPRAIGRSNRSSPSTVYDYINF